MVSFLAESWTWFSVVLLVAISRLLSRRMALGSFKRLQADEFVMCTVLCFYTTFIVTINIVQHTNSNLLPPGYDVEHMTQQDISQRRYGSKLILLVEQCQCVSIWGAKTCLLIMYLRLTTLQRENIAITLLCAYVAMTFVVMEVLYLGVWCRPFSDYWAVPTPNVQCDAATNHLITNACFNLTSDVAMLAIGLPMFLKLQMLWRKKIPLIMIFSLGIFVIVAAILNKVYSFTQPFGSQWTGWYVRESSTALIVANLPFVWTLWRKITEIRSIKGLSRQDSTLPTSSARRYNSHRHDSEFAEPVSGRKGSATSSDETEMAETPGQGGGMTLGEMLRADLGESGGEISPLTHPALFHEATTRQATALQQMPMARAVLGESPEQSPVRQSPVRRGLGSDVRFLQTLVSSPSLVGGIPKPTGSFL